MTRKDAAKELEILKQEPSGDCISRYDAIAIIKTLMDISFDKHVVYVDRKSVTEKITKALKKIKSSEPKRGKWVELGQNKDGTHNICCDVCGEGKFKSRGHARSYYTTHKFKYCPNCGAKMKND